MFAKWVAAAIAALLVIVVLSYRQTCHAYPNGGGAFAVSLDNFGENAALTAAARAAGRLRDDRRRLRRRRRRRHHQRRAEPAPPRGRAVGRVHRAAHAGQPARRQANPGAPSPSRPTLRRPHVPDVRSSARSRALTGQLPDAATATQQLQRTAHVGGIFTLLLVLRAFASGCTALTGVEAISNGVPAFRPPEGPQRRQHPGHHGCCWRSPCSPASPCSPCTSTLGAQPSGNPSVISQIAAAVFGGNAALFYLYQAATAGILILAANTAFNGFPVLSSILAEHRYLPRQLHTRGDKLVFSNGIILLGGFAIALIVGFDANIDKLIQLYIIGVFTSFTLSQAGMVRHWNRTIPRSPPERRRRMRISRLINTLGAVCTAVVLVIVLYTKVAHGAWIAILAMIALFAMMKAIRRHYDAVAAELDLAETARPVLPSRNHAIVLVSRLHLPTLRAIAYANATRPSTLDAVTIQIDDDDTARLLAAMERARNRHPPRSSSTRPSGRSPDPSSATSAGCAGTAPATSSPSLSPNTSSADGGNNCCTTKARCDSKPGCYSSPASWSPVSPGNYAPPATWTNPHRSPPQGRPPAPTTPGNRAPPKSGVLSQARPRPALSTAESRQKPQRRAAYSLSSHTAATHGSVSRDPLLP